MSERKINLEKIFKEQNPTDTGTIPDWVRSLCIEACRQTLELAAENAKIKIKRIISESGTFPTYKDVIDVDSILNTINQIE